jgi:hypothetical protein
MFGPTVKKVIMLITFRLITLRVCLRRYGNKLIRNLRNVKPRDYYPKMQDSTTDLLHVPTLVGARDTEAVNSEPNQWRTEGGGVWGIKPHPTEIPKFGQS